MNTPLSFADLLRQHIRRTWHTPGQLANLSGLPKATIVNWLEGRVSKPRHWSDLVKLAGAMHLDPSATTELLQSAGYCSLVELYNLASDTKEGELFAYWQDALSQNAQHSPFQAVADLPYFVGREQLLAETQRVLLASQSNRVLCLHGMAGAGKTALATRLVYLLRAYFPDGILWGQLNSADTMSILNLFASAYGRDVSSYTDLQSRSTALRALLSDKRVLIVLDDAQNSEQVRPLLPPTGTCAVIVTTRHPNLGVMSGFPTFEIGPFDTQQPESLELFTKLLGHERVETEKADLLEIAKLLGHLPLALAIVASRLSYEPNWFASDLLAKLDQDLRLDELVYENWSVNLSLQPSYDALTLQQQAFFASLGGFGSNDFSVEAVGVINEVEPAQAVTTLRNFYSLSLIQKGRTGRFRLHPLICDFARQKISTPTAFERIASYFVQYAEIHTDDYPALDLDLGNILEALKIAHEYSLPDLLLRGTNAIYHFLEMRGLYSFAVEHLRNAREVAISLGDDMALARIMLNLGRCSTRMGENKQAELFLLDGLALARGINDSEILCDMLLDLGTATVSLSRYEEGKTYYNEGLALAREMQYTRKTGVALMGLGILERRHGNYDKAEAYLEQALEAARTVGDKENLIRVLNSLTGLAGFRAEYTRAEAYLQEGLMLAEEISDREATIGLLVNAGCLASSYGNLELAETHFSNGLTMSREMGNLGRAIYCLVNLGEVLSRQNRNEAAEGYFQEAVALSRRVGEVWMLSSTLNSIGGFYLKLSKLEEANTSFAETYELAQEHKLAGLAADALFGLARVASAGNSHDKARSYAQQSLAMSRTISGYQANQQAVENWMVLQGMDSN